MTSIDFAAETTPDDIVTRITTRPLTDNEEWGMCKSGEFIAFEQGLPV